MLTITQYEYLNKDIILSGIVDWMVKESPMLKALPQQSMQGNSLKYNVSTVLAPVQWTTVGTQITEGTGTFVQRTADIYTMIQNSYTDKGEIAKNATQNPETRDIEMASQAIAQEWENAFIFGQTTTTKNTYEFKGLMKLIAELESESTTDLDGSVYTVLAGNNSQVVANSTTTGALVMAAIDAMIDQVKPGKPDVLLMSRMARRKLNALQRASGGGSGAGVVLNDDTKFGIRMETYDLIPINVSDYVPDNIPDATSTVVAIADYVKATTRVAGTDNSIMFAIQMGEDKLTGLQAAPMRHERDEFSADYDAITNRIVWQTGLALKRKYSAACLVNFNPTD